MPNWGQVFSDLLDFFRILSYHIYTYFEYAYKKCLPKPPKSLSGEIVLVTGSGRGIGRYLSMELAKHGATVVCWSKSAGPNEEVVRQIIRDGGSAYAYTVDVADKNVVHYTAQLVRKEVGEVTMVVNNAGIMKILPFVETSEKDIETMFNVNVLSNFWVLKNFLPSMLERNRGHIVSICSAAGLLPTRNLVPYSSTKHAVHGFHDALRDELRMRKRNNVKITTVYPFYCSTEMLDGGEPHTRFPFLFPIDPPGVVAEKIVEGVRRELEYIYTPRLIGWLALLSWCVPLKSVDAYGDFFKLNIDPAPSKASYGNGNQVMNHSVRVNIDENAEDSVTNTLSL